MLNSRPPCLADFALFVGSASNRPAQAAGWLGTVIYHSVYDL